MAERRLRQQAARRLQFWWRSAQLRHWRKAKGCILRWQGPQMFVNMKLFLMIHDEVFFLHYSIIFCMTC